MNPSKNAPSPRSSSLVPRIPRRRQSGMGVPGKVFWTLAGAVVLGIAAVETEQLLGERLNLRLPEDFRLILGTAVLAGMFVGGMVASFIMSTNTRR